MADISKINIDQLAQQLTGKFKNLTIVIPVVFLFFLLAVNVYRQQVVKSESLKENIEIETERSATLDRIVLLNERLKKFKQKGWSSLDSSQMMGVISDKAIELSVKLGDVTPHEKINKKNYVILPFSVNCETTYKDLVRFFKALESYGMLFRIQNFDISVQQSRPSAAGDGLGEKAALLRVRMIICSIYFK